MTQKTYLKFVARGWIPIETGHQMIDFGKMKRYVFFSFKNHKNFQCRVASSKADAFRKRVKEVSK